MDDNLALSIMIVLVIGILGMAYIGLVAKGDYDKSTQENHRLLSIANNYSSQANINYQAYMNIARQLNDTIAFYNITPIIIKSRNITFIWLDDVRNNCGTNAWACAEEGNNIIYMTKETTTKEGVTRPTRKNTIDICNHEVLHLVLDLSNDIIVNGETEEHKAMSQLDDIVKFQICEDLRQRP